jgi:hypothetical protein
MATDLMATDLMTTGREPETFEALPRPGTLVEALEHMVAKREHADRRAQPRRSDLLDLRLAE